MMNMMDINQQNTKEEKKEKQQLPGVNYSRNIQSPAYETVLGNSPADFPPPLLRGCKNSQSKATTGATHRAANPLEAGKRK